jgi:hypothetical protein
MDSTLVDALENSGDPSLFVFVVGDLPEQPLLAQFLQLL